MAPTRLLAIAALALAVAAAAGGCWTRADPWEPFDGACVHDLQPTATSAEEAWPERPDAVPVLTGEQILEACAVSATCRPDAPAGGTLWFLDNCVAAVLFNAERTIPLSFIYTIPLLGNERAEFWVQCVLDNQGDCALVESCLTPRSRYLACEEDGCTAGRVLVVECAGTIATLSAANQTFVRDCSRAYAECDPKSRTGCTDRHYTRCPAEPPLLDRCDGDIRLGCDGGCNVSYHDCARMGGSCETTAGGLGHCVYPATPDCVGHGADATCGGGLVSACVNDRRVTVPSALCP